MLSVFCCGPLFGPLLKMKELARDYVLKSRHLGVEDLLRHGGLSRAKQKSKTHARALAYHLAASVPDGPSGDADDSCLPVTPYQAGMSIGF